MSTSRIVIPIVLLCGWAGCALALPARSSIGLSFDPAGESCQMDVSAGTAGTLYILVYLGEDLDPGFTGAEFRVTGVPAEWFVSVTPAPAVNAMIGNPLTTGVNVAFPTCQYSPSGVMPLFTVTFFATTQVTNRVLDVTAHANPPNPAMPCPQLYGCGDFPCPNTRCVLGRSAAINDPDYCIVPVGARSWSQVRRLYR